MGRLVAVQIFDLDYKVICFFGKYYMEPNKCEDCDRCRYSGVFERFSDDANGCISQGFSSMEALIEWVKKADSSCCLRFRWEKEKEGE